MEDTGIIAFLILGALAGWLAGKIMRGGGMGLIGNIIVGIVGAVIGGSITGLIGNSAAGFIGQLVTATLGAVILLFIVGLIKK